VSDGEPGSSIHWMVSNHAAMFSSAVGILCTM